MQLATDSAKEVKKQKKRNWKRWSIHLFPIPALLIYGLFVVYPLFAALTYSFFDWNGMVRGDFVGLKNFKDLFTLEPFSGYFWNAFGHNILYFVLQMIFQNGLAFALAYIIFKKIRGAEFLKISYFLPRLLSVIVVGFLWKLILNPNYGALNVLLEKIGLGHLQEAWLGDPDTALIAIILVNSWYGLGFGVLIFLAGFQSIPKELMEAGKLDGATGLAMVRRILIPLMIPSIMIMTVLTFIQSFEAFELVYAMQGSQGEPYHSTDTLAVYFYRLAFGGSTGGSTTAVGLGSALAVVLFLFISIFTGLYLKYMQKKQVDM
ncbi:ABC transporter permease subunit [Pontibacillus yanchengensis]|uniref:ABC transporter permease subunit n=2 Tax=Pontibacillus yanchengensis TaxID=462910 RepID=A0ACC7VG89_9BACI|nr:sugar ABC transporter permease [Pontibacillus yanchengensis]MYL33913.1 ABC transporter permease subunit [Pontibacillus yanchengensis]MYL53946.1 ABC transporter permease subunit [Pontibacillus yanchengensis]